MSEAPLDTKENVVHEEVHQAPKLDPHGYLLRPQPSDDPKGMHIYHVCTGD